MGSRERLWEKYGEAWGWPPAHMTLEADHDDPGVREPALVAGDLLLVVGEGLPGGAPLPVTSPAPQPPYPAKAPGSSGTSTACSRSTSSGTMSSARSWVEARTTNAAAPSSWASSQLAAVTHQRSPASRPGKR